MTEEEIEMVAKELAKIGGASWYPGRSRGLLLRVVSNRYRDRACVAIAALDRLRARKEADAPQRLTPETHTLGEATESGFGDHVQVGSIVVYRPPEDQRAIPCRVEKLENGRAYLVPCPHPDVGWVLIDSLPLVVADDDSKWTICRQGVDMRWFFHLVNGHEIILDDIGIEVPDLETAKAEAQQAISELRQEYDVAIDDWAGWRLDIVCPEGTLLYSFPLSKTLH
jgi:hypothetical protein